MDIVKLQLESHDAECNGPVVLAVFGVYDEWRHDVPLDSLMSPFADCTTRSGCSATLSTKHGLMPVRCDSANRIDDCFWRGFLAGYAGTLFREVGHDTNDSAL